MSFSQCRFTLIWTFYRLPPLSIHPVISQKSTGKRKRKEKTAKHANQHINPPLRRWGENRSLALVFLPWSSPINLLVITSFAFPSPEAGSSWEGKAKVVALQVYVRHARTRRGETKWENRKNAKGEQANRTIRTVQNKTALTGEIGSRREEKGNRKNAQERTQRTKNNDENMNESRERGEGCLRGRYGLRPQLRLLAGSQAASRGLWRRNLRGPLARAFPEAAEEDNEIADEGEWRGGLRENPVKFVESIHRSVNQSERPFRRTRLALRAAVVPVGHPRARAARLSSLPLRRARAPKQLTEKKPIGGKKNTSEQIYAWMREWKHAGTNARPRGRRVSVIGSVTYLVISCWSLVSDSAIAPGGRAGGRATRARRLSLPLLCPLWLLLLITSSFFFSFSFSFDFLLIFLFLLFWRRLQNRLREGKRV